MVEPVIKKNLSEQVMGKIMNLVTERGLQPGNRIPTENELSDLFGVGRSTIREAVRQLENLGVLSVKQGKGTFLQRISVMTLLHGQDSLYRFVELERSELQDIMDVRKLLEAEIVRRVTRFVTDEDIEELKKLFDMHKAAKDSTAGFEIDIDFHMALARMSGNSILPKILELVRNLFIRYTPVVSSALELPDYADKILEQHRRILEAIIARDEEKAVKAMLRHLGTSQFTVLANFDIVLEKRRLHIK